MTTVPVTKTQKAVPLQKTDFVSALLIEFNCFTHQQAHFENNKTCAELQKDPVWLAKIQLPAEVAKDTGTMKLLHFTYVFQIFVFMQLFNQFNARLLEDG